MRGNRQRQRGNYGFTRSGPTCITPDENMQRSPTTTSSDLDVSGRHLYGHPARKRLCSPPIPPNPQPTKAGGSARANVGSSGAYQTDIPIAVPSYHGLEPHLKLAYNSQAGPGWPGTGWSLSGLSSVLRTSPGRGVPNYDAQDVFYLDGMQLIFCQDGMKSPSCLYPASPNDWAYTTRVESYRRIAFDPARTPGG